jgi:DNA-binding XRE family transcriptional regulator
MSSFSLRELREAAGLTQAELAARAGVSRQLVGAVEVGRHLPRVDAALALAAALNVDVGRCSSPNQPPSMSCPG